MSKENGGMKLLDAKQIQDYYLASKKIINQLNDGYKFRYQIVHVLNSRFRILEVVAHLQKEPL